MRAPTRVPIWWHAALSRSSLPHTALRGRAGDEELGAIRGDIADAEVVVMGAEDHDLPRPFRVRSGEQTGHVGRLRAPDLGLEAQLGIGRGNHPDLPAGSQTGHVALG